MGREAYMKQEIIRIDLNGVNCYLIKSEEGFVLIDTGGQLTLDKEYTNRQEKLMAQLEEAGCIPGNIKAIILTHGDIDHTANAAYLRDHYQTIIAMHEKDIDLVENTTLEMMMESFHYRSLILKILFFLMKKPIQKLSAKTLKDFTKFTPDVILQEGDDLSEYGITARVIHLPGHTAGSIGVLMESGELIAGDLFANNRKPGLAPNANDFKQLKHSTKKLEALHITKIYPGHGDPFEAKDLKI
jgi:glyoxylase-like metal-dependent hydrolase (beta-lactamase superfamily II)